MWKLLHTQVKILSKTVTLLYIINNKNGSVYYIRFAVLAGKCHEEYNLAWINDFRHSLESKGCLRFRLKDFPK